MLSKVGIAQLLSVALGYSIGYFYFSNLSWAFGGLEMQNNLGNCVKLFFGCMLLSDVLLLFDSISFHFGPDFLISKKKSKPSPLSFQHILFYQVKTKFFVHSVFALLAYFGFAEIKEFPSDPIDLVKTVVYFQGLALLSGSFRDATGMHFFHKHAHLNKETYHLHKAHHTFSADISIYTSFVFDWCDLFLENGVGTIGAVIGYWLVYEKPISIYVFLFQLWLDGIAHSVNPFAPAFLNPFLDYFFNPTIAHNLHHALLKQNYYAFPYHHLQSGGLEKEYKHYDKVFGTQLLTKPDKVVGTKTLASLELSKEK